MKERIYKYMKDFGSITTLEAVYDLGCTRLSEYIRQLKFEHNIASEWVKGVNRYGEKVHYKRFWIEESK